MVKRGLGVGVRVRFTAALAALAGAAVAHSAAAELNDASLNAGQRRAIAVSGLPRASIVSVKPDMVVAIRNRGTPSAGGGVIEGVVLQGEVVSSNAAQVMGYRSMRSTVNVDCVRRRDLVVKMAVFSEPNAQGEVVNRQVPGGWVQPSPDAYLSDVMRSVCASVPRTAVAETPPLAPVKVRSAPEPKAPPAPIIAATGSVSPPAPTRTAMLDADRPVPTSVDARMARLDEAPAAPTPSPPRPAPAVHLRPAVAPPAVPKPPATKAPAPKAPTVKAPTVKAMASRPAAPGKVSLQIAASPTEAQAREALARIRGRVKAPLSTSVRSVTVDGKVFHRALINGFQNRTEAQAFCASVGGACFIR